MSGFQLHSNYLLTEITGFRSLSVIKGDMSIRGNSRLTTLFGLEGITQVEGELTIQSNEALPECEAQAYAAARTVGAEVTILENDAAAVFQVRPRVIDLSAKPRRTRNGR